MIEEIKARSHMQNIGFLARRVYENQSDIIFTLDLNPPYQRQSVWSEEKKRNLWKSLLMGLPIGSIFLNFRGYEGPTRVVDGKQRLEAIADFYQNKLSLPGSWINPEFYDGELPEKVYFKDLNSVGQRVFRSGLRPVSVYETELKTEAEEAELYLLVNFGGVAQTKEDRERAQSVTQKGGE